MSEEARELDVKEPHSSQNLDREFPVHGYITKIADEIKEPTIRLAVKRMAKVVEISTKFSLLDMSFLRQTRTTTEDVPTKEGDEQRTREVTRLRYCIADIFNIRKNYDISASDYNGFFMPDGSGAQVAYFKEILKDLIFDIEVTKPDFIIPMVFESLMEENENLFDKFFIAWETTWKGDAKHLKLIGYQNNYYFILGEHDLGDFDSYRQLDI